MAFKIAVILFMFSVASCATADINCRKEDIPPEMAKLADCCPIVSKAEETEVAEKAEKCVSLRDECSAFKCVAKQFDLGVSETGMVDKEKYRKFVESKKTPEVAKMWLEALDECYDNPEKDPCKVSGFFKCIVNRGVKKCPSTKIWNPKKMKECDVIKPFIEKCGI